MMSIFSKLVICVFSVCVLLLAGHATEAAPPASAAVFEWRPDLGGWHDTSNNLVWGYASMGISNSPYTQSNAEIYASSLYASDLLNWGYEDEAIVAAQYSWRLPSLAEYQDAYNKGLFWEDEESHIYDASPADGFQSTSYGFTKWTSTLGVTKDKKKAYYFDTTWGSSGLATKTSGKNVIPVRKHIP
jgi:hypothetical protein